MKNSMPKQKHVPERMCLGCRHKYPKRDMVRIVKTAEGMCTVDLTSKQSGRGAYVCRKVACMESVRKNHSLEKAFKIKVNEEIYDELAQKVAECGME